YITLEPPSTFTTSYVLTLPSGAPISGVGTCFVTMDTGGHLLVSQSLNGSSSNPLTASNLSPSAGILGTQLANNTLTGTQMSTSVAFPGSISATNLTLSGSLSVASNNTSSGLISYTTLSVMLSSNSSGSYIHTASGYVSATTTGHVVGVANGLTSSFVAPQLWQIA